MRLAACVLRCPVSGCPVCGVGVSGVRCRGVRCAVSGCPVCGVGVSGVRCRGVRCAVSGSGCGWQNNYKLCDHQRGLTPTAFEHMIRSQLKVTLTPQPADS